MWRVELLDGQQKPVNSVKFGPGTHDIGRDVFGITDLRLSRKQCSLTLPATAHGRMMLKVTGPNPSFHQAFGEAADAHELTKKSSPVVLGAGDVVWLGREVGSREVKHPIRVVRPPSAPASVPAAVADSAHADQVGASWQVKLGGSFKPYEEQSVHEELEAALAGFEDTAEVVVRGTAYCVCLKETPMRQVQKADPTKWRQVRRVAPPTDASGSPEVKRQRLHILGGDFQGHLRMREVHNMSEGLAVHSHRLNLSLQGDNI